MTENELIEKIKEYMNENKIFELDVNARVSKVDAIESKTCIQALDVRIMKRRRFS